jgi:putative DNA primase/helicase
MPQSNASDLIAKLLLAPGAAAPRDAAPKGKVIVTQIDAKRPARVFAEAFESCVTNIYKAKPRKRAAVFRAMACETLVIGRAGNIAEPAVVDCLQRAADASGLTEAYGADKIARWLAEASAESSEPGGGELIVHRASDIAPEAIEWAWPGRIAVGKLTLIAGDPGLGKSNIAAAIVGAVTAGLAWPCGEGDATPGSAIMLCAEDGAADTIVPRLLAAGARLDRVHIVPAVKREDGGRRTLSLAHDLDLLEQEIAQRGNVRLVVIDPVSSYMGKADDGKNTVVRAVLEPIAEMASRLRVAVLCVTHLSKGGRKALYRFTGSIAFVAAARSAFMVVADPADDTRRLLLQCKSNIARAMPGLAFRLVEREVMPGVVASLVEWEAEHFRETADQVLAAAAGGTGSQQDQAVAFLREALAGGAVEVGEIEREARAAGLLAEGQSISQRKPLRNACKVLRVVSHKEGFAADARWFWSLPAA